MRICKWWWRWWWVKGHTRRFNMEVIICRSYSPSFIFLCRYWGDGLGFASPLGDLEVTDPEGADAPLSP